MAKYPQSARIRLFFSKGRPLTYGKGEVILGNSDQPDGVYYISSGYVKVYAISEEGNELLQIIYGPGEIFPLVWAYLGIVGDGIYYEALCYCIVFRIARAWLTNRILADVALSNDLAVQLAQQFQMYIARVNNLEYKKADQRVAYRLLLLAAHFGVDTKEGVAIDPQLTREVFASSINLTRETFSREIQKLACEKLLRTTDRHIIIVDMAALADKAGKPSITYEGYYHS